MCAVGVQVLTCFLLSTPQSTLLNLILGFLEPLRGSVSRNGRLRIGHFTQHSADKFDLQLSSVENMMNLFQNADDQEMRSFLGRFQIQGSEALKPMFLLSGGQKSRVAFASLAYQKPHVIIMDEVSLKPTREVIATIMRLYSHYSPCFEHIYSPPTTWTWNLLMLSWKPFRAIKVDSWLFLTTNTLLPIRAANFG